MAWFRKRAAATMAEGTLPVHVAVIMDGNGRWAQRRGLPRTAGHAAGANVFRQITRYANKRGVQYLTVYAFSTENWKRSAEEVSGILDLLRKYLTDAKQFADENIRVRFIGDITALPDDIVTMIRETENMSASATGLVLNIAFNYGGRDELVRAARALCLQVEKGDLAAEQVSADDFAAQLDTVGQPDVDLLIRTGGEFRTSNFLPWQAVYAELWFSNQLWPDFTESNFDAALAAFGGRERRIGGVK